MTITPIPHAIDAASNRCRGLWNLTKIKGKQGAEDEGLCTWLTRVARESLEHGEELKSGKIRYKGMKFTFIETKLMDVERIR